MALITIKVERRERAPHSEHRRGRGRPIAVLSAVAVLAAVTLVGASAANAGIVSIPPQTLLSAVTVPSNGTVAVTVLGDTATVPTDATRVRLDATVTNPAATGTLTAYPSGHPGGGTGLLHFTAATTAEGNFTEQVGLHNRVQFKNGSGGSLTLTVKITGYSTNVDASDITAKGGSAGQVLTNTGTGAAWSPAGHAYGVDNPFTTVALNMSLTVVASVTVPAGSYVVTFNTTIANSASTHPDNVGCYLFSPDGSELTGAFGNTYAVDDQSAISAQGLVSTTTGGSITAQCVDGDSSASAYYPSLIANAVGAVDGSAGGVAHSHVVRPHGPSVH